MNALYNSKETSVILTNVLNVTRMLAVITETVFVWRDGSVMDRHAHLKGDHQVAEAHQEAALLVALCQAQYQVALQVTQGATVLRVAQGDLPRLMVHRVVPGVRRTL